MTDTEDNPEKSLQGQLLVASRLLHDPNFAHAVILIVQHGAEGALGLVLNRPLELTVQHACEQVLETSCDVEGVLYAGGPCEGLLMVIHTSRLAGELEVMPGVFFSTEREKIEWLLANHHDEAKYFVGYAGWGPGQLETEMSAGSWLVSAAARKSIFEEQPHLWKQLMTALTVGRWIDPAQIPDDPSVN